MKSSNSGQGSELLMLSVPAWAGETPAPPKTCVLKRKAFTLVEILIVVVILGILAAIVTALFNTTVDDAAKQTTRSELAKLRRHVGVYKARHAQELPPSIEEGNGTWGELVGDEHFLSAPVNAWVGGENARVIIFGEGPDLGYQRNYGWIYDPVTGEVWAGGFDEDDNPYPRNALAPEPPADGG